MSSDRKKRSENFSYEETKSLIAIWKSKVVELKSLKRNHHVFNVISEEMHKLGYDRDSQIIHFKINNLTQQYRKLQRKLQSGAISQADINLIWPFFCPIEEIFNSVVQFSESEQDKVLTNTIPLNRIETNNSSHDVRQSIPLFADMTRDSERVPMNDPKDNIRNEQSEHLARIRLLNKAENRQLLDMSRKRKRSLEIEDVLENSFKIQQDIKLSLSKFHDDQMAALNQLIELQQESNNIQSKILKLILDKSI